MNRNPITWLAPLLAVVVLGIVASQTVNALRASGAWSGLWDRGPRAPVVAPDDPFTPVHRLLLAPQPETAVAAVRDPFRLGSAPAPVSSGGQVVRRAPAPAAVPETPLLTAIVWDADPRALVRWQGREWTIRAGGLFDEFQVVNITREQVTLTRGTETIVLQRKAQGD